MFLNVKKQLICFLVFCFMISFNAKAQNEFNTETDQFYKVISFDEKVDFGIIDTSVTWIITNLQNNISTTLHGNDINNYQFKEPGEYQINFQENKIHTEACNHPLFAENLRIKVLPVKISFDFSKIEFSEKLQKGVNYTNLLVSIPVKITIKENSIQKIIAPSLAVSGIGVSLTTKSVENEIILNNQIHLLKYKVSGIIEKETFLMFDFYDLNNQAQTYNLSQIIK
ncbi:hypothetical protein SAMN06265346_106253 [Flavobacterium hercynium]|nr:hypothetical protein SAMN06265346_106253 [Flavobacterium hercynium]